MAEILNQYEAMFLLPSGAASDVDGAVKVVRALVEKHGGQVQLAKKWDERKLAYEVDRNKRGLYVITYFKAPGSAVTPLEREVSLSDNLLRVLITRADHLNEAEMNAVEPQPIAPREERNPWDRPSFNDRPPRGGDRDDRGGGGGGGDRGGERGGDRPPREPRARREDAAEAAAGKE